MTTAANVAPIVAVGAMDNYLTARPSVTFFKLRVAKHTAFAMETVSQNVGQARFGSSSVSISLMRTGDLLHQLYLAVKLPSLHLQRRSGGDLKSFVIPQALCQDTDVKKELAKEIFPDTTPGANAEYQAGEEAYEFPQASWVDGVGHALLRQARVLIGGQQIDSITGRFLSIYEELSGVPEKDLSEMVGMYDANPDALIAAANEEQQLYVPLCFWFATHSGSALPLVSLQFHSLSLEFEFAPFKDLVRVWAPSVDSIGQDMFSSYTKYENLTNQADKDKILTFAARDTGSGVMEGVTGFSLHVGGGLLKAAAGQEVTSSSYAPTLSAEVYAQYIYCDQAERDLFATGRFLQLAAIHQNDQFSISKNATRKSQILTYNFATKEIIFAVQRDSARDKNQHFNFQTSKGGDMIKSASFSINGMKLVDREAPYYRLIQPYQHHTRIPPKGIYCYSFALSPETAQPSGSLNLSRIDNFTVSLEMAKNAVSDGGATCYIFARSLNLLRYGDGLAGPMFGS